MAMRVELFERPLGGGPWAPRADVPGLGSWETPADETLGGRMGDAFTYRQAVARLAVPFAYRFRVSFRWLDADGAVVREEAATTRACRQPDVRPDLAIVRVRALRSWEDRGRLLRYTAVVRNAGPRTVRRIDVAATLPGDPAPNAHRRTIRRLHPGEVAEVTFKAPPCAAGQPPASFAVDPDGTIDERDEANNTRTVACDAS
jgi:hypothetical protein